MIYSEESIIARIRHNLTPDLLAEKRLIPENAGNPMYGHCYHASQALWVLTGMIYEPVWARHDWRGGTHWWLRTPNGILDITADQYYSIGKNPPYEHGEVQTWRLSRRTLKLLDRVAQDKFTHATEIATASWH